MNTAQEICDRLSQIIDGMWRGTVIFTVDKLSSAMKCGHPADILDEMVESA